MYDIQVIVNQFILNIRWDQKVEKLINTLNNFKSLYEMNS